MKPEHREFFKELFELCSEKYHCSIGATEDQCIQIMFDAYGAEQKTYKFTCLPFKLEHFSVIETRRISILNEEPKL